MGVASMAPLLLFVWSLLASHICLASVDRSIHIIHFDKSFMPKVFASHHHWHSSIIDSIKSVGPISSPDNRLAPQLVYSYGHAFHGFSAMISKDELEVLKTSPGFVSAYTDKIATVDTTHSTEFLSLSPDAGLWPLSEYGKDIIIGVVDTGIRPESPSFRDDGMTKVPARWKGICEEGQEFNSSLCNKKLIGARSFNKAVQAANPNLVLTMNSARDTTGHGTHVASTAAGNYVEGVSHFGYARGTARGVAPRARIAVYKVLTEEGNSAADIIAGIDQAVADGVDVLSLSLGFDFVPLYEDPIAIASFGAMENGIFVSTSAGNAGTRGRLHNGIPWALTVAAGTMDRWFAGTLTLSNGVSLTGWTMYPASAIIKNMPLVYNKNISACNSTKLLSQGSNGIIICDDIGSFTQQIDHISRSNWQAAIFISDDPSIFRSSYFPHPGIVISHKDASKIIQYASNEESTGMQATIRFQQTFVGTKPAPVVSGSSSRGPSPSYPGILKPDIMAPGVLILAAWVLDSFSAYIRPNIVLSTDYNAISGTSMSCPHASGIVALLKSVHLEWSPAAIRSAMMTTSNPLDNAGEYIKDSALNYEIATPLAMGAGHVDPNRALDPGLIYDATPQDYANLICSINYTQSQFQTIIRSAKYNCTNPSPDLNYPSFIALYSLDGSNRSLVQKFRRTVTNVGDGTATYKAAVISPNGSVVTISPETLVFNNKYQKRSYSLTIRYRNNEDNVVTFGLLTWVDNTSKHTVRSPIVVSPTVEVW